MLALFTLTAVWFLTGFTGAMMPGAISTMAIVEGSRRGFRAGPLITLGHGVAELGLTLLLLVGLSEILRLPVVTGLIGVVGGGVLLWMGVDIARAAWSGRVSLKVVGQPPTGLARLGLPQAGLIASVINPYWILWWSTVGAAYLLEFIPYGLLGIVAFYVGHILADLVWNSFLAAAVSSGRGLISDRVYQGVLLVCGLFLILLSAWFVWSGVGFLRSL